MVVFQADGKAPFIVGIQHPREKKLLGEAHVQSGAIATSGDYERFFEKDSVRYHHILDPKTGQPASQVRSATIIAPTATRTDGLSKTAFVGECAAGGWPDYGLYDAIMISASVPVLPQAFLSSLKPGGRLVLQVLNRDYVIGDLPTRVWWEGDGCVVLDGALSRDAAVRARRAGRSPAHRAHRERARRRAARGAWTGAPRSPRGTSRAAAPPPA